MTLAQEIYESLLKDPDLDVGPNQTREEFAKQEAEHRARQHYNNVEALALANQPLKATSKSSITKLTEYLKDTSKVVLNLIKEAIDGVDMYSVLGKSKEITPLDFPMNIAIKQAVGQNGKDFLNALQQSNIPPQNMHALLSVIKSHLDLSENPQNATDLKQDIWPFDFIKAIHQDSSLVGGDSQLVSFQDELSNFDNFAHHINKQPFKAHTILEANKDFYGTTSEHKLATKATVNKVNKALEDAGHKISIGFGGGMGNLKINNHEGFNPYPGKTQTPGRLYTSMMNNEAPPSDYDEAQKTQTITASNISDFSVADILNAVNWITSQSTDDETTSSPTEEETAEQTLQEDVESVAKFETDAEEQIEEPNKITQTQGELAKGKPHVIMGGWGHKNFHKKEYWKNGEPVANSTLKNAITYGLCNEKGQVNTIGHVLLQDAYDKGILGKKEVYEQDSHVMLKAAGIQKLLEHHGIDFTNGKLIPSEIAKEIAGMDLVKEDMPDIADATWNEIATKVAGEVPVGGVPEAETLDNLVIDTADELNISPTPPVPTDKDMYIAAMKSHAARANAAMASGDEASMNKHKHLLSDTIGTAFDSLGEDLLQDEVQEAIEPQIDVDNQTDLYLHLKDNVTTPLDFVATQSVLDEPVSPSDQVGDGDEPVSPSEQTQTTEDVTTPSTPTATPTPTQTTAPVSKPQDVTVASLMDKHNDVIEHMYEQTYGKDNAVTSLEEFKADKAEEFAEMGTKKAKHEIAVGHNKLKASKQKEAEQQVATEEKTKAKEDAAKAKVQAQEEKEAAKQQAIADKEEQAKVAQKAKEEQIKATQAAKEEANQEKQKMKEANVLPHKAGDLEKIAGKDSKGNMNELPEDIATLHAMELAAHQKQYKDHMSPKTQAALKAALVDAQDKGADIQGVMDAIEEMGNDFGSPDHLKDLHNKAVKGVEFYQNHKELISGNTPESQKALEDAIKHGSHSTFTEFDEDGKATSYKDHPDYEKHKDANKNHKDIVDKIAKDYNAANIDPADMKEDLDKIAKAHSEKIKSIDEQNAEHKKSLENAKEMKWTAEHKLKWEQLPAGTSEESDKERAEHQEILDNANAEIKDLEENKEFIESEKERERHADSLTKATKDRDDLGKAEQGVKDFNSFKEAHHDEESKKEQSKQHHLLHTLDPIQQKHADALKQAQKHNDKEGIAKAAAALKESGVPEEDIHHMSADGTKKDEPTGDGPPNPEVAKRKMAEGYVWNKETRHWILKETLDEMGGSHGGFDASIVSAGHGGNEGGAGAFALNEHGEASDKNFLFHGSGNLMAIGDGKHPTGGSISANNIVGNALHGALKDGGHLDEHESSGKGITKLDNFSHPEFGSSGNSGLHHLNAPDAKPTGWKAQFEHAKSQGKQTGKDIVSGAKKPSFGDSKKGKAAKTAAKTIAQALDPTGISQAKFAAKVIGAGGKTGGGYLKDFVASKVPKNKVTNYLRENFNSGKKVQKAYGSSALSLLLEEFAPDKHLKHKQSVQELIDSLEEDKDTNEKPVEKSIMI